MEILIAGGTGFIGQALVSHLSKTHSLTVLGRDLDKIIRLFSTTVTPCTWEEINDIDFSAFDVVINLCGKNIGEKRWSEVRKQALRDSRLIPTNTIVLKCLAAGEQAPVLFNASAVGIYGHQVETQTGLPPALTEISPSCEENLFSAQLVKEWEATTSPLKDKGHRVVNLRFGVVLGKGGGVLTHMLPAFKYGLGGKVGSGQQPFPWVAMEDVLSVIDFLLVHPELSGPVNIVSPNTVTQHSFAKALSHALHRPCLAIMPAFLLKWLFGQMAEELVLHGANLTPAVLQQAGFAFQKPDLSDVLKSTLE